MEGCVYMIKKICLERNMVSGTSMHIIYSVVISGGANVEDLKVAIDYAVNNFESLRCRILQDEYGDAYYVMRENRCSPFIEVRDYHLNEQEFMHEQQRIPFRYDQGELVRFYIEKMENNHLVLRMVLHHLGGDGKSGLVLIDTIMRNLQDIAEKNFQFVDKELIPLQLLSKEYLGEKLEMSDLIKAYSDEINRKWKKEKVVFDYDDYLQMFEKYWETHNSSLKCVRIKKNVLKSVHKLAKENGVSINSVLVTAVAKYFIESEKIVVVVDSIPDGYGRLGNFAGGIAIDSTYDEEKSFWDNAIYLHNQIHACLKDRNASLFGSAMKALLDCSFYDAINYQDAGCYENELVKEYNAMFGGAHMPLIISNIGRFSMAEQGYGRFSVEEVQFGSPKVPSADCNMGVVSVGDHMVINMEYDPECDFDFEMLLQKVAEQLYELANVQIKGDCILS